MGCGASTQPKDNTEIPTNGKAASGKKKEGKYLDAGSIEKLLLGSTPSIKLLKASVLLTKANEAVGTRQQLEADEPEVFPDDEMLKRCIGEVWKTAQDDDTHCTYPAIVALSYCWKTKEHPDPDGDHLNQLQGALRWYMANRAARDLDPDFLVFIDFHSLYQGERTSEQQKLFSTALENMDVMYAHRGIMVWVLSDVQREAKGWMEAGSESRSESPYYDKRGWPTFERLLASLCKGPCHCLDMGRFLGRDELQMQSVQAFRALSKEDMARLADPTGPQGEHYADEGFLATLVKGVREAPMTPEEFRALVSEKGFSVQSDEEVVARLYRAAAESVLGSLETGGYSKIKWEPHQLKSMGGALSLARKLTSLTLSGCGMTETGLSALASALQRAAGPALHTLVLTDNKLEGEEGWKALGEALRRGALPNLRSLEVGECRMTKAGLAGFASALEHKTAPALQNLVLCDNELEGEEGWKALGEALRRGALPNLRFPDLKQCGMCGPGLAALASALELNSAPALETLAVSFNEIEGEEGWKALGEALRRGALPNLRSLLLEWCGMTGAGLVALASALELNSAPALETLDVVGNEVEGEEGWKALGEALRRGALPNLRRLLTAGLVGEGPKAALQAAVAGRQVDIS